MEKIKSVKKLFLIIGALLGCMSANAYDFKIDGVAYTVTATSPRSVEVSPLLEEYEDVVTIPASVTFGKKVYLVTSVGDNAFKDSKSLKVINLSEGIDSIGNSAFAGTLITSIKLPETVSKIKDYAFYRSALTSFTCNPALTSVGNGAFQESAIKSVELSSGLLSIGDAAFKGCAISSVQLPDGLTYIGASAFQDAGLTSIVIPNSVANMGANTFYNCRNLKKAVLPEKLYRIPNGIFVGTDITNITMPKDVTEIGASAFERCKAVGLEIPKTVKVIENSAFQYTKFTKLDIPSGVRKIGDYSFSSVDVPVVTLACDTIGKYAFYGSSVKTVIIKEPTRYIGEQAFSWGNLTTLQLPNSLEYIGPRAFSCTQIDSITLPPLVKTINDGTFSHCLNLRVVNFNDALTYIGADAFQQCTNLKEITLPKSMTGMGGGLFRWCTSLAKINMAESKVEYIQEWDFDGCSKLAEVIMPNTVNTIGICAFIGCSSLERVYLSNTLKAIGCAAFQNCTSLKDIVLPKSFREFVDGGSIFSGCTSLQSVTFNSDINMIPDNTFQNCKSLTSINIPNSVESIGRDCFNGCEKLTNVKLPEKLTSLSEAVFGNCTQLSQISLPSTIKTMGKSTFYNCSNLCEISLPADLTVIGETAFAECANLTKVAMANNVTSIGRQAFENCVKLENVTMSKALTEIGASAFRNCSALPNIIIPKKVISIGAGAFNLCQNLYELHSRIEKPFAIESSVFENVPQRVCSFYVPTGSAAKYKKLDVWKNFLEVNEEVVPKDVESVTMSESKLTIKMGATAQLKATVYPEDAEIATVIWSSSDSNVATVDQSGNVAALHEGTCIISAKSNDGTNLMATCNITVEYAEVPAASLSLDKDNAEIQVGSSIKLTSTVLPVNATRIEVLWNSTDNNVALVDSKGTVIGIGEGVAKIIAQINGNEAVADTCVVTILPRPVSDNDLAIATVNCYQNSNITLPVAMTNKNDISAFQCDIVLPEGITLNKADGNYDIQLGSRAPKSHSIVAALQPDGSIRIVSYSSLNEKYKGNTGDLFILNLNVGSVSGSQTVMIKNLKFSDNKSVEYSAADLSGNINVEALTKGDSNGDGKVSIADITNSVNYLLGVVPENFKLGAADINNDGLVTIGDITKAISILLGTNNEVAAKIKFENVVKSVETADKLTIDNFSIMAGSTSQVAINLTNAIDYTALQLDLYLPEGLTIAKEDGIYLIDKTNRFTANHVVMSADQKDGAVRIVAYSPYNSNIKGNTGALLMLNLVADKNIPTEVATIYIKNALLSTNDVNSQDYKTPDTSCTVLPTVSGAETSLVDGLKVYAIGHNLIVESDSEVKLPLYNMSGSCTVLSVVKGMNSFNIDNIGVYVVNGKKVVIK